MLFNKAPLLSLTLGLLLGFSISCKNDKSHNVSDQHHLTDTYWTEATGQYTLHFNSPEEVKVSLTPAGTSRKMEYLIGCEVKGDSLFVKDYSVNTPFGEMEITKNFKGAFAGTDLTADFGSATMEVKEGDDMPSIVPLIFKGVVFKKK